ncbi:MAG: hypothetical protein ACTHLT_03430 [Devosia sp.]
MVRFIQQTSRSLEAIEDGEREAPRDRWDPQYVVDTVGIEPADLYAWVRDEIEWMPYPGALRGPAGVLMDRIGNSLDQALLLADMLQRAGNEVRLAHAKLPPERARQLWQRMLTERGGQTVPGGGVAATGSGEPAPDPGATVLQTVAATEPAASGTESAFEAEVPTDPMEAAELYELDTAAIANELSTAAAQAQYVGAAMDARILDQAQRLLKLVALPEPDPADAAERVTAALADHWWVQLNDAGTWVDLDPVGATEMGAALMPAVETLSHDALPDELEYAVTLRVVVEQWKEGATQERVVLEQAFRPREMMGQTVVIGQMPMFWTSNWPEAGNDTLQIKLRAAVYAQHEWLPFISIGGEQLALSSVYDTGDLNQFPQPPNPYAAMGVPAAGIFSKAGDLLSSDDQGVQADTSLVAPRPEGELVAEWLDFVVTGPGGTHTIRREIFDLIGPAARASGDIGKLAMSDEKRLARAIAMLTETRVAIFPARLAPEFITHVAAEHALGGRSLLEEAGRDPFSKAPANSAEIFAKIPPLAAGAMAVASARFDGNPVASSVYIDRPNIIAEHAMLLRGKGGDFFVQHAVDIVENGVGIDPAATVAPIALRVAQGIADTNAEALVLGNAGVFNTAEAFAAATIGDAWTVLQPGDEASLATLNLSPDVSARIAADLEAGKLAVLPTGRGPEGQVTGWWRIDPATGETLGMGPNGWGQAMVEYALVLIAQTIMAEIECQIAKSVKRAVAPPEFLTPEDKASVFLTKSEAIICGLNGFLGGLRGMLVGALQARIMDKYKAQPASAPPGSSPSSGSPPLLPGAQPPGTPNPPPASPLAKSQPPAPPSKPPPPAGTPPRSQPEGPQSKPPPPTGPAARGQPEASSNKPANSKDQAVRNAVDARQKEGEAARNYFAAKAQAEKPGATAEDKAAAQRAYQQALQTNEAADEATREALRRGSSYEDMRQWNGAYRQGLRGGSGSEEAGNSNWAGWTGGQGPVAPPAGGPGSQASGGPVSGGSGNSNWAGWTGGQGPVAPPASGPGQSAPDGSGTLPGLGGNAGPASATIPDMQSPVATTLTGLAGLGGAGGNLGL